MADIMLPQVTDHALVRYMERVMGLDLTSIRTEIEQRTALAVSLGATAVRHAGFRYVIAGDRVVSVIPCAPDQPVRPDVYRENDDG